MREYLSERDYPQNMENKVMPLLNACRESGEFEGFDGVRLCYSLYSARNPRGSVVIVHGFTETSAKYREIIYYFLKEGYTVCVFDQRGHGYSPRTAPPSVTHVDRFDEYVEDLRALLSDVGKRLPAPHALYCHSMGGAVGALYLIRYPGYFDKAVLSSPMLAPKHDGLALPLCRLICRFCMCTGRSKKRIFVTRKPGSVKEETLDGSASDCAARFEYYRALREGDPRLCGGAPSYGWTYTALGVTKEILRRGAPENIRIPVLLFSAESDTLVQRKPQETFISRVPYGEFVSVPTKHEIYVSRDGTLFPYLNKIMDFLQESPAR